MRPTGLRVHPSCLRDWILLSVRSLPDGGYEIRARPRPVPPFRAALEDERAAYLTRPSRDPEDQYQTNVCVFYIDP